MLQNESQLIRQSFRNRPGIKRLLTANMTNHLLSSVSTELLSAKKQKILSLTKAFHSLADSQSVDSVGKPR